MAKAKVGALGPPRLRELPDETTTTTKTKKTREKGRK